MADGEREDGWLRELARLKPARFPVALAVRTFLAAAVPLFLGLATGQFLLGLYVTLGALMTTTADRGGAYRTRFRQLLVTAPLGALGFTLGHVVAGHGWLTVVLLAAVGLLSGLLSGYGAAFSLGSMQMLVFTIVTVGVTSPLPWWVPSVLYLAGGLFTAVMLALESLVDRRRPERAALRSSIVALAELSAASDDGDDAAFERARQKLTDVTAAAYRTLLDTRARSEGRTLQADRDAVRLAGISEVSSALIAAHAAGQRTADATAWLSAMADALAKRGSRPPSPPEVDLESTQTLRRTLELAEAIWPRDRALSAATRSIPVVTSSSPAVARAASETRVPGAVGRATPLPVGPTAQPAGASVLSQLLVGRAVVTSAVRLALCIGIAAIAQHWVPGDRSYWIGLTVALVLKPDFGSVFARAVQRSIGTVIGVAIGVGILALVPKSELAILILIIALLAAVLPWSGQRGYGLQSIFLAPFVLLIFDLISPGPQTVDYGAQRLLDTVVGCVIVLVFGYLIWPRSLRSSLPVAVADAVDAVAAYVRGATVSEAPDPAAGAELRRRMTGLRRTAYRTLSDLRIQLQRSLAEPPPASREAKAWFPAVAAAERLCDRVTVYAQNRRRGGPQPDHEASEAVAAELEALSRLARSTAPRPGRWRADSADEAAGPEAMLDALERSATRFSAAVDTPA
ncbi:membrane protein [Cnuibacter physcomitrellae]|uniref:Integral membrane bound transporter domain-containing protein n=1 Tax=Cnuibacter physcomitrellae TaxID=1619308 RepID=A0A1X9LGW3_9MICO|nr:FUSC family protein [Cnuibacter physcomitrellae]ARJ04456.1 hypothetical protein B5808_03865 [Cnuibacter physcomitrellae]GGI41096.1 membrane protein [Cnuibacter physcomitrellae]